MLVSLLSNRKFPLTEKTSTVGIVCRMVTVLEFHGYSENDAFVAVIAIRKKDITRGQMR